MAMGETDLHALALELSRKHAVVGSQIAVLVDDQVHVGTAGVEGFHTGVAVCPETHFQIGSTTKIHTAVLVMQLVEQGLIGLDVPVVEQLPTFRLADADATAGVTPRHLMSMSSGMDNGPYTDFGPGPEALARYVASLVDVPHSFVPGTGFGYSNASTNVSGRLVEHVSGLTWEQALTEHLLGPAGLESSAIGAEGVVTRRFAVGHAPDEAGSLRVVDRWGLPRSMGPAGGTLCGTAGDLVRLARLFIGQGEALTGELILTPDSIALMQSPQVAVPPTLMADWWGLGPYGRMCSGMRLLGHSGTNTGGSSYVLWSPEQEVAVATTVNTPQAGYSFAKDTFTALFPTLAGIEMPASIAPPDHVEIDHARLVGTYVMSDVSFEVAHQQGELTVSSKGTFGDSAAPSLLIPLGGDRFLPTDPVIDGGRGWALAFLGEAGEPASLLLNGFFAMRRSS